MRLVAGLSLAASLLAIAASHAQQPPRRPNLGRDADTNDARAYFELGRERLERNPEQAAAAFYWAARLDPGSPQTPYAEGIARLLRRTELLVGGRNRDARVLADRNLLAIDSLRFRAELQDPFFHRGLDEAMLSSFIQASAPREQWLLNPQAVGRAGQLAEMERYLESADPYSRGQFYYSRGQLRLALDYWAIALRTRNVDWVYAERARAWHELRQLDSARANMEAALRNARGADAEPRPRVYESRAAWEYALGRILEDLRQHGPAREAYTRALAEDGAYYVAHFRLGVLALAAGDSAGAGRHFEQAVARGDTQYFVLAAVATIYSQLGRHEAAAALLRRATEREPWAAPGHLMLARVLGNTGDTTAARAAYERFTRLAPRNDANAR
jgi:tetratricopeptide (TPR) repeat protein